MQEAAEVLEFERAAMLRDQIFALKKKAPDASSTAPSRKNTRRNKGGKIISDESPFFL
jgi:excinuclease UvrABC nuclease subunit